MRELLLMWYEKIELLENNLSKILVQIRTNIKEKKGQKRIIS